MNALCLAAALFAAQAASSQQTARIVRDDIRLEIKVEGTVVAADTFRIKSEIAGRVEAILPSTGAWARPDEPLGLLASREMAAILDSSSQTAPGRGMLEARWSPVYNPEKILCPEDCFVIRTFVKPKQWVRPKAVLVEAARKLTMIGRVRPDDARWVEDGQTLEFWASSEPGRKFQTTVDGYELDVPGSQAPSGGSMAADMPPSRSLPPGTKWEGLIIPLTRRQVLKVPTAALIDYQGASYLPIRVSTGITTETETELTGAVPEGLRVLILDEARLKRAKRHARGAGPEPGALKPLRGEALEPAAAPEPEKKPAKDGRFPEPGVDYGSEPYAP